MPVCDIFNCVARVAISSCRLLIRCIWAALVARVAPSTSQFAVCAEIPADCSVAPELDVVYLREGSRQVKADAYPIAVLEATCGYWDGIRSVSWCELVFGL